jgi:hypothetical protein
VKTFPLSDSISLALAPSIMESISDFLRVATQKIYINLRSSDDTFVTQLPLNPPIRRVTTTKFQYVSQITHQLAAKLGLTPAEICQQLQPEIAAANVNACPHLAIWTWHNDTGDLYFQLTPSAMIIWLNYIHDRSLEGSETVKIARQLHRDSAQSPASISLYAHARCCAVLRLAGTEKIISIDDRWQITTPNWLICDHDRPQNCPTTDRILVFELPIEDRLIHALMDVLDGICGNRPQNWVKLTRNLAESWLEFDRYCQIFGDTKRQNPPLAIARCGLTAISRRYLQVLLEDYLGVVAPVEL